MKATSPPNLRPPSTAASRAEPIVNTRKVCSSRYRASKPMIDGVSMRLSVTVWNITVDTATATPTSIIARSLVPRNGRTKSHEPFAPTVMNAMAASSRPTPSPIMTQRERRSTGAGASPADDGARSRGRSDLTSSDTGTSPQQEEQERGRADHADDDADRHLVRVTDRAPEEVAHEHEAGPAECDPGCGASQVVPEHQGHDVGYHEPQERDRADGHDDDGGHHRDDRQAEREHGAVVHAEVRDEVLPHARDGEPVGDEVGHHDEREREPQQLVAATQHAGEVARHPRVERLHQV